MYYSTAAGQVVFGFTIQQYAPPRCACGAVAAIRGQDGRLFCALCFEAAQREAPIEQATAWLAMAFRAAGGPERRKRLYRALAAIFHPDVGGDVRLMQALNAFQER